MLSTVSSFGPSAAIMALGYAAEWGDAYYNDARDALSSCEKDKEEQHKRLDADAEAYELKGQITVVGGIPQLDNVEDLTMFVNVLEVRHRIERSCWHLENDLSTFTATHLSPYFPLISSASLPAAALVLSAKLAAIAYRALKPANKMD